jgi:hypothetical protein
MKMEYGAGKPSNPEINGKAAADSPSLPTASLETSRIALEQFPATASTIVAGVVRAVTSKR